MRLILQRVSSGRVEVAGEVIASIDFGLLVFVAVERSDGPEQVSVAVRKLSELRLFEDDAGRFNRNAREAGAQFLIVSQFTLVASLRRGRRPSFDRAAPPEEASRLIDSLNDQLRDEGFVVETGRFGARMDVVLSNQGPATFCLDIE